MSSKQQEGWALSRQRTIGLESQIDKEKMPLTRVLGLPVSKSATLVCELQVIDHANHQETFAKLVTHPQISIRNVFITSLTSLLSQCSYNTSKCTQTLSLSIPFTKLMLSLSLGAKSMRFKLPSQHSWTPIDANITTADAECEHWVLISPAHIYEHLCYDWGTERSKMTCEGEVHWMTSMLVMCIELGLP